MAESKPDAASNFSPVADKEVKSPNALERAKEEFEAIFQSKCEESNHYQKETHGLRKDIDEDTSINDVKGPNMFERAQEEIEALVQTIHPKKEADNGSHGSTSNGEIRDIDVKEESRLEKTDRHLERETHGMRNDIDEKTPINDVKAPNVFERAKEEIEALVQTIHHKKESKSEGSPTNGERRDEDAKLESKLGKTDTHSAEKEPKSPNLLKRAKEEIEALFHKEKSPHRHHKETHGKSDEIDENSSIEDIKGPNVFERAKEEIEAIVQAIHPKKESPKT